MGFKEIGSVKVKRLVKIPYDCRIELLGSINHGASSLINKNL
jgi:hypothetical protein